jgi:hypothetical protein
MIEHSTFISHGIRYSAATATPAPLTPSSAAMSRETTTTTTAMTMMTTMTTRTLITSPATIESTGATVLVPHLALRGFDVVVFTELSCAVLKHADARAVERNRCADVHAFVLGQGRRDDDTKGAVVGDNSGGVHHGGRGTDDGVGDANDIL